MTERASHEEMSLEEKVAFLEGELLELRMATAILFYALRTGRLVELVSGEIQHFAEGFEQSMGTLFPNARDKVLQGFNLGIASDREFTLLVRGFYEGDFHHIGPPVDPDLPT